MLAWAKQGPLETHMSRTLADRDAKIVELEADVRQALDMLMDVNRERIAANARIAELEAAEDRIRRAVVWLQSDRLYSSRLEALKELTNGK